MDIKMKLLVASGFAALLQLFKIGCPVVIVAVAKLAEIFPAVDAAVMAIAEVDLQSVVARLGNSGHLYIFFAGLQYLLASTMASNLGAGGVDPEIFTAE